MELRFEQENVRAPAASLPALEPEWALRLRADQRLLTEIAEAVGGPFHVLCPDRFVDNLTAFQTTLAESGVPGQVYFGKKANKSGCWLRACAEADAGVDVASVPELAHALRNGVRGEDIVVTGAAKTEELLWLAARQRCLIAVDAVDELERVIEKAHRTGTIRILLRVLPEHNPDSRFGLAETDLRHCLRRCAEQRQRVRMEGFSFHLNGYAVSPRAALADRLIDECLAARELGLVADSISIGGGFAVNYLDPADWRYFERAHRSSWFHANRVFSHFYPYAQAPVGADMLDEILASPTAAAGERLRTRFLETGTRLLLEPGRALLDGCGFSVFPVQGSKRREDYGIVTVSGLSMSVSEQWKASEYLPDPILWPEGEGQPINACIGGSSCLDYDMLTWRKVPFTRLPKFGDLLIYPNTAGYQMDKNETEFHQLPLPDRIIVSERQGRWHWRIDKLPHIR